MQKSKIFALALAGCLSIAGPLATIATASAQPRSGNESFTIIEPSPGGGPVIAHGAFSAAGTDVELSPNSDTGSGVFIFPGGTITAVHTTTSSTGTFNPKTCVAHFQFSGTYVITGGTGAYAGASGSGTFQGRGTSVGCDQNTASQLVVIHAHGPISFAG